jgi:hypothetical protein
MVRKKGLEPLRPFGHQLLRLARLPIPPLPHRKSIIALPQLADRSVSAAAVASVNSLKLLAFCFGQRESEERANKERRRENEERLA